ncbi:carboxypeptidase-like regulatory domain-containing protein [Chitinophagaceae bacterium LB-8]|uniref:Carboxypeptidase-like regulatory domain-containing protein n=1 Tax=Paraflavisolibacter caeni TaxID=2982496 RepID=A0A9X3BJD4_9BACT|nr:carboxypeptidase-like regulatory domain-containing protein [Paraflavisolibacter caeni]MCU7552682.1 carboxypeptidase-like regulatory domain-containing protein [Paraflavisolibacter caeni]
MILKCVIGMLLLPVMLLQPDTVKNSYTLNGIVVDKVSGKPLPDIYLYTVKGEEEAITNQRGEFKLITWKKLPVVLHVRNVGKEYIQVKVTDPSEKIVVKL